MFSFFVFIYEGNFTTMPEAFKAAGYEAMSFGKIFHPGVASGSKSPSNQGGKTGDDYPYSWTEKPYHAPTEKNKQASVCPPSIPGQRNGTLYVQYSAVQCSAYRFIHCVAT